MAPAQTSTAGFPKARLHFPCCDGWGTMQQAQDDQCGCRHFSSYLLSPALKLNSPGAGGLHCTPSFHAGLVREVSLEML